MFFDVIHHLIVDVGFNRRADPFKKAIESEFGSFEGWLKTIKAVATTRGIGWAILSYDPLVKRLVHGWVDEQHIGQLGGLPYIAGIDMWEHSYVYDYQPSGKKQYIDDFFDNINWQVVERSFSYATGAAKAA